MKYCNCKTFLLTMFLALILVATFPTNGFTVLPPLEIVCPPDITIECDESTDPINTGYPEVPNNDFNSVPVIEFVDGILPDSCPEGYTIIRTWIATDETGNTSTCDQTIEVVDTVPPDIQCNAPATITPPDAPITFVATATDNCEAVPSVDIIDYDCFKFTNKGKKIDKTESCIVEISGDAISIVDSGGVDNNIEWTVRSMDNCGNLAEARCSVVIVNPIQQP